MICSWSDQSLKSEAMSYKWIGAKSFILLSHQIPFSVLRSSKIVKVLIPFFVCIFTNQIL